jgi:hypothetical protein
MYGCLAGYSGLICEYDINECHSNPCLNGGLCVDGDNSFSCTCQHGYDGVVCEIDENAFNASYDIGTNTTSSGNHSHSNGTVPSTTTPRPVTSLPV